MFDIYIVARIHPKGLQRTCMSFNDPFYIVIISVYNSLPALLKQQRFATNIVIHILVFVFSDMIFGQIRKDTVVKGKTAHPVEHQSL